MKKNTDSLSEPPCVHVRSGGRGVAKQVGAGAAW